MSNRKPDYRLKLKLPNGEQGCVGAAWLNEDGHINLVLNAGVVLSHFELRGGGPDKAYLTLFPEKPK